MNQQRPIPRSAHRWPLASIAILSFSPGSSLADQTPPGQAPALLLVRIDAVRVAAQRPDHAGSWDEKWEPSSSGAGCKLLALAAGAVGGAEAGTATGLLCRLAGEDSGAQGQSDPKAPDLLIKVTTDPSTVYRTYIAADTYSQMFQYSVVLPVAEIPRSGLQIIVLDQDGASIGEGELIGSIRISKEQLLAAALDTSPTMTLKDGPLEKLELVVESYREKTRSATHVHPVNDPMSELAQLYVHAGEMVEIHAEGQYSVASNGFLLGPAGYQDGSRRAYNLPDPAFGTLAHGAAVARVGHRGARAVFSVDGCVSLASPFTGTVSIGVNDRDRANNHGTLSFDVVVRPPRRGEWAHPGRLRTCAEYYADGPRAPATDPPISPPPDARSPAPLAVGVAPASGTALVAPGSPQAHAALTACAIRHDFHGSAEFVIEIRPTGRGVLDRFIAESAPLEFVRCVADVVERLHFEPAHGRRLRYPLHFE
jgi:hypothetical protein